MVLAASGDGYPRKRSRRGPAESMVAATSRLGRPARRRILIAGGLAAIAAIVAATAMVAGRLAGRDATAAPPALDRGAAGRGVGGPGALARVVPRFGRGPSTSRRGSPGRVSDLGTVHAELERAACARPSPGAAGPAWWACSWHGPTSPARPSRSLRRGVRDRSADRSGGRRGPGPDLPGQLPAGGGRRRARPLGERGAGGCPALPARTEVAVRTGKDARPRHRALSRRPATRPRPRSRPASGWPRCSRPTTATPRRPRNMSDYMARKPEDPWDTSGRGRMLSKMGDAGGGRPLAGPRADAGRRNPEVLGARAAVEVRRPSVPLEGSTTSIGPSRPTRSTTPIAPSGC